MKITMTCHNNQNTCEYFGDSFCLKKSKKKKKKKTIPRNNKPINNN